MFWRLGVIGINRSDNGTPWDLRGFSGITLRSCSFGRGMKGPRAGSRQRHHSTAVRITVTISTTVTTYSPSWQNRATSARTICVEPKTSRLGLHVVCPSDCCSSVWGVSPLPQTLHHPKVVAKGLRSGLARQNSRASTSSRELAHAAHTHRRTHTHIHIKNANKNTNSTNNAPSTLDGGVFQTQCSHRTGGEPRTV